MKVKNYQNIIHCAWALSHKHKYGKVTDPYRLPRKLKKAAKKHNLI